MKLHREAFPTLVFACIIFIISNVAVWRLFYENLLLSKIFLVISFIILLLVFYFFRVRIKNAPIGENVIASPAYGKVVNIETVFEGEFYQKEMKCLSIFMSPLNIHCNYVPIQGKVNYFQYHPGKYLVAFHPKSSELNEHTSVGFQNEKIEILVKQIAGFVARRIIPYLQEGQQVNQNDELGFIRFGSRVDVFLPLETELEVSVGDKVQGARTVLARY